MSRAATLVEYESIGFKEKIEIVEVDTKIGNIQDEKKVLEYMPTGAVEKKPTPFKAGILCRESPKPRHIHG